MSDPIRLADFRRLSDIDVGLNYLFAAALTRIHRAVDASAEQAHQDNRKAAQFARRSIGQIVRRAS